MPEYDYFVSYFATVENGAFMRGEFGYSVNKKIESMDEVSRMRKFIEENLGFPVVITNFILLGKEDA